MDPASQMTSSLPPAVFKGLRNHAEQALTFLLGKLVPGSGEPSLPKSEMGCAIRPS